MYDAAKNVKKLAKLAMAGTRRSVLGSGQSITEVSNDAHVRHQREISLNQSALNELLSPSADPAAFVRYGQLLQLQHVRSGHFLTCSKEPSPNDRDTLTVGLDPTGNTLSHFR
jgi:hypothetical protein